MGPNINDEAMIAYMIVSNNMHHVVELTISEIYCCTRNQNIVFLDQCYS